MQDEGERDLASVELWERSLERSRRRRASAAARGRTRVTGAHVSAALLTATVVAPVAPAVAQELQRGSHGEDVAAVQRALGVAADGEFGPVTRRAVRDFQAAHGLEVDGVVGPITSQALFGGAGEEDPHLPAATVSALQSKLGVAADGVYGPVTRAAVRRFQSVHGLQVDGVAGPVTLGALGVSSSGGGGGSSAVGAIRSQVGEGYALGGTGPDVWDCSGLTQWAFA